MKQAPQYNGTVQCTRQRQTIVSLSRKLISQNLSFITAEWLCFAGHTMHRDLPHPLNHYVLASNVFVHSDRLKRRADYPYHPQIDHLMALKDKVHRHTMKDVSDQINRLCSKLKR